MLEQQSRLIETQSQVASGKKNLAPSDDPAAVARVLEINEAITQMGQYDENSNYATQRLNFEETTIDSSINVLQRVRELTVQAANTGVNDLGAQQAIAAEIKEKLKELLDYANTKDAAGDYLFSGYQSRTQPFTTDALGNFVYNGDQGQMSLQIGANRQVASSDSGADLFQFIRTGNSDFFTNSSVANGGSGRISTGSLVTPSQYPVQDYAIVFDEIFPVNTVSAVNNLGTVGVASSSVTNAQDSHFSSTVEIYFDPANPAGSFDVIDRSTGNVLQSNVAYTTGMTVNQNGWQIQLTGAPQPGDRLTVTANNQPQYEYNVINTTTGATVLAAQPYVAGSMIAFDGLEVAISGQPLAGDVFTVEASRYQDVFTTLSNLSTSLDTPGSSEVRGMFGGDYINNGFDVGDTVSFGLQFDGVTIPVSHTVVAGDTNATIAAALFSGANGISPNGLVPLPNPDGSFTIAGTTPGASVTFRRVGDNIEFTTTGGTLDNPNSVVINNLLDNVGGDAVLSILNSGSSVTSQTTLNAAVAGDAARYLVGVPPKAYLSQQMDNALINIDRAMEKMIDIQTRIGGRINSIESQTTDNEAKKIYLQGVRSDIEDIDVAEAISRLTFQTSALQIAQQTFVRIQGLNLFDYLR